MIRSLRAFVHCCGVETTLTAADTLTAHVCAALDMNGACVGGFCSDAWTTLAEREATATYADDRARQTVMTNRRTVAVADQER